MPGEYIMAKRDNEGSRYALTQNIQLEGVQVSIGVSWLAWTYPVMVLVEGGENEK